MNTSRAAVAVLVSVFSFMVIRRRRTRALTPRGRYAKQELILGKTAQARLETSIVCVVGCGGLAACCLPLLVGAGIGEMVLVDDDLVQESNLHRQTLFTVEDVGKSKVDCARSKLELLNPSCTIRTHQKRITSREQLLAIARQCNVIVDCCDNSSTRYIINSVALSLKIPLVSASAIATSGQLLVVNPFRSACYRCVFPSPNEMGTEDSCNSEGVLGPIPAIMGSLQALETIKIVTWMTAKEDSQLKSFEGNLLCVDLADLTSGAFNKILVPRSANCIDCSNLYV